MKIIKIVVSICAKIKKIEGGVFLLFEVKFQGSIEFLTCPRGYNLYRIKFVKLRYTNEYFVTKTNKLGLFELLQYLKYSRFL